MLSTDQPVKHNFSSPLQKSASLDIHRSAPKSHLMTPEHAIKHVWIITGPAGSGKTTVAKYLATELCLPYVEGDDWHPEANKDKMAANIPLTDADRWDWLGALREESLHQLQTADNVVVTCSALKHKYRDVMRVASVENRNVDVHFIYLKVDEATLKERVAHRQGHYMKDSMVHSQMQALEEPDLGAEPDVIPVESRKDAKEVQRNALEQVKAKLREY
jgi:gluconokinase